MLAHAYRSLRLRLPQPWSGLLARLVYLPQLLRGHADTRRELSEEPLIERMALGDSPLERFGRALSERVVEIPWVFRRLDECQPTRVLDIGTAFSPVVYKRLLVRRPGTVEVVDLAHAGIPGLVSHVADVRDLPFGVDSFDVAVCISMLEHVGMDNAQYGLQESTAGGDVVALRELGRVARRVLVTVPAGADADLGSHRQYAPPTFRDRVAEAGLEVERLDVFAHDPLTGWAPIEESAVQVRTYGDGAIAAAASICATLRPR